MFDPEQAVLDPNFGGSARHAKHIQDDQMVTLGGDSAGELRMSVMLLVASIAVRFAVA